MKKVLLLVFLSLAWLSVSAQALVPITWTAYGLTFEAPKGILVEEDTEETFLLNNSKFYITIQSLDSDGMTKSDLKSVLKDYANDDGVKDQSAVQEFELPQFFGTYLRGSCETDHCLYAWNPNSWKDGQKWEFYPQRMRYPSSLENADPEGYKQAVELLGGSDNIITPLWWTGR